MPQTCRPAAGPPGRPPPPAGPVRGPRRRCSVSVPGRRPSPEPGSPVVPGRPPSSRPIRQGPPGAWVGAPAAHPKGCPHQPRHDRVGVQGLGLGRNQGPLRFNFRELAIRVARISWSSGPTVLLPVSVEAGLRLRFWPFEGVMCTPASEVLVVNHHVSLLDKLERSFIFVQARKIQT